MAFVDAALAVGAFVGADALGATAATAIGGGLMGAGAGALYGGLTGGDVGKDALYGGMLGGLGGFLGAPAAAEAAAPTTMSTAPAVGSTGIGAIPTAGSGTGAAGLVEYGGMAPQEALAASQNVAQMAGPNTAGIYAQIDPTTGAISNAGDLSGMSAAGRTTAATSGNSFWDGLSKGQKWMLSGAGGITALNALGLNKPTTFNTPGAGNTMNTNYYKLDPSKFQPGRMQSVTNPVMPTSPNYVKGYKSGGSTDSQKYQEQLDSFNKYQDMLSNTSNSLSSESVPKWVSDVGIFNDTDPNTKYQDPMEAAQTRMAAINARAGMPTQAGGITQVPKLGQIDVNPLLAQQPQKAAEGGIMGYAMGGQPNQMYPQSMQEHTNFAESTQYPTSAQQVSDYEMPMNPLTGDIQKNMASGGITNYSLGGYANGDMPRLLKGPGDGVSDSIPATIGGHREARLADGEFVVPARVVSELGNGSTEAGAKRLHKMMDGVEKARKKSVGKGKIAVDSKAYKSLPKA